MSSSKDEGADASSLMKDLSLAIDSLKSLLEMVYAKSEILGHFCVMMVIICPVYAIYTWGKVGKPERAADEKPQKALKKKLSKGKKAGGKK
ncbi:hypothetical protein [Pseudomonas fitomaticsae]|uniref:Uncharacterized protein n=1 Tax=Pseudomonas fitomaticsae TaxID=2837969 RepID=A0ABY3Q7U1_9PSED|nr:hypothetical protein [Pseudomonas fitomaticsae]UFQ02231.1 hypothetical protein KJY40_11260 [Pseudomonas fitomaticsae]